MTDETNKETQSSLEESSQQQSDQVESRRKFTKAGLAGSAVLMSVMSRTALGTDYSHSKCKESVLASWHPKASKGSFNPDIVVDCNSDKDCSHRFWKNTNSNYHQQCWNNVSRNCDRYDIYPGKKCREIFDRYPDGWENKTLLECLNYNKDPGSDSKNEWRKVACREAVTGLFNCSHSGICQTYLPDTGHSSYNDMVSHFNTIRWNDKSKIKAFCTYYSGKNTKMRPHYPMWG